jgi:hypothetical protein
MLGFVGLCLRNVPEPIQCHSRCYRRPPGWRCRHERQVGGVLIAWASHRSRLSSQSRLSTILPATIVGRGAHAERGD